MTEDQGKKDKRASVEGCLGEWEHRGEQGRIRRRQGALKQIIEEKRVVLEQKE